MKISVIIPVYNAEKFITQAVKSALQFDEVYEIILIEDQSTDLSLKVCLKLAETNNRIKLYQHPDKENHGAGATRNLGMQKATGNFIAFLDADDYYLPNRFEAEKELFKYPEIEGTYGAIGVQYYSQKAKEQYYSYFGDRLTTVYQKHDPENVFPGLLNMRGSFGVFSLNGLTIRRSSLPKLYPFFKVHLRLHQDTEFIFRLSYYLNLYPGIIDRAVAIRGIHENNRITKIGIGKIKPATSRILLWNEVNNWAENESSISIKRKKHIRRVYRSFKIDNAPFFKKWGMIITYLIIDYPSIRSGLYNVNFRKHLFYSFSKQ